MPDPDDLASTLDEIRDDNIDSYADGSTSDLPRILAAIEKALKKADDWDAAATASAAAASRQGPSRMTRAMLGARSQVHRECAQALRETIGAALAGKEAGDGD